MSETFSVWDSADYIHSDADAVEYLAACMEEGGDDPAFLAHALGVVARARNMGELARQDGSDSLTLATVVHVLKELGCRLSVAPLNDNRAA